MLSEAFRWSSFLAFALTNSFTPGPNVIMLASSGGAWGLKRTLPHLFGVSFGLPIMLLLVQFGSAEVFKNFPWAFTILRVLSLAYVFWLAIRIFKMGFVGELKFRSPVRPMNFLEASLFQWMNGKAWQICLMISTLYATEAISERLGLAGILWIVTFAAGIMWIELGKRIAQLLERPMARKVYYSLLAVALLLSTWASVYER